ncbi:methyltransferase domain-containing protein [Spirulina sp. CS-785/01]|uniref:methyltransferase domain-containing protein n=1 Tax=Spirulina sp. CS-785/01 TaxID=3021716 RepID=UPI00232C32F2|nr:methyltransferase domain-containing protein [Spirulina sp. CS-785/01]MDB9315830.1 methyltransferase domain-containing protein [Spirulina sp. CS-785/01]
MKPDIGYIPTPADTFTTILELAQLTPNDIFYDLGCGAGNLLIAAVQKSGCRGVGVDIDPQQIAAARQQAEQSPRRDRLSFHQGNLFTANLRSATVVFLYLLPHLNLRLRPQLFGQLQPQTRIISHQFDLGDWPPKQVIKLPNSEEESTLYYWEIS